MSYTFNSTKAQRRMIRRWCLDNGVYPNSHPRDMDRLTLKTHNGMGYYTDKNYDRNKYANVETIAWMEWTGQSLEELSDACAFLRMTLPTNTAIVLLVRSPPPTPPSKAKPKPVDLDAVLDHVFHGKNK